MIDGTKATLEVVWNRFSREKLALISFCYFVILLIIAIFANVVSPYEPQSQDIRHVLMSPGSLHWFGTDELGRDVFSRLLFGSRASIEAGVIAILIPMFVGVPLGVVSGYLGGIVDDIFMRIFDALLSFPAILLALGITGALGPSLENAMIAIGVVFTPQFARLARGQALQVRRESYVESARISGAGPMWVMGKHVVPNILGPIIVQVSFSFSFAILLEASLSFLGLGAQPPQASWGGMLREGYSLINLLIWPTIFPALALLVTVMAGNFLGDGLRIMLDPKTRRGPDL